MRIQTKILFLLVFIIASIFLVNCSISSTDMEDNTYLTPIPWSTLEAYRRERPITNRLDAVFEATQMTWTVNLIFPKGTPKVTFAEEMGLSDAYTRIGQPDKYLGRPGDTKVWLVIFEGSWQSVAPTGEVLPEETGCIYVILDAQKYEGDFLNARTCVPQK